MVRGVEQMTMDLGVDRVDALCVGLTGLPALVEDPADFARRLRGRLPVGSVVVAADALTMHIGALDQRPGAVVAAGTGVVALGTDHTRVWNQADGWGLLLGDEGSGAWIGEHGLRSALRAADGRPDGSPHLLELMRGRLGDPLRVVALVYAAASPAHHLASFAPAVAQAARAGDPVALRIWQEAGTLLGRAVVATTDGLVPRISWGGGLFAAGELLLEPFHAEVRRALPDAQIVPPVGASLEGAATLAERALDGDLTPWEPHLYLFDPVA
jgi:N-acetylglucosamine kinase-like BadF-type ATPase